MKRRCLWSFGNLVTSKKSTASSLRHTGHKSYATKAKLEGIAVAPFTPFGRAGDVDLTNIDRCGDFFKRSKFNGLFVNGTLGESLNMTSTERKKVAEKWKEVGDKNGLFMILHVGAGNLRDTQELAKHAEALGVDAIAALPTTYYKPTTEEHLVDYLEKIAESVPNLPLMYYDYNIATGVYLNIPRMLELAEKRVPTLCGMKHTSPELISALNCATVCGGKYKIFFGTETLYLPSLSLGIPDIITTPVMGDYFYNIKQAYDSGDMETAQNHQLKALTLSNILQANGGGIGGYKTLFKLLTGIDAGQPRIPLPTISANIENKLRLDLQNAGFQIPCLVSSTMYSMSQ